MYLKKYDLNTFFEYFYGYCYNLFDRELVQIWEPVTCVRQYGYLGRDGTGPDFWRPVPVPV